MRVSRAVAFSFFVRGFVVRCSRQFVVFAFAVVIIVTVVDAVVVVVVVVIVVVVVVDSRYAAGKIKGKRRKTYNEVKEFTCRQVTFAQKNGANLPPQRCP